MVGGFSIRQYRPGDDERIRELHETALREADAFVADDTAFVAALPEEVKLDADLEAISATYIESGGTFLVGERDGKVVAMGAFRLVDDATAEIKRMRVDPAHQRRGYGHQILDALEADAINRGVTEFTLDTLARQTAAREFYETNGYHEYERESFGGYEVCFYHKSVEKR